jgi:hypothetical protein
MFLIFLCKLSFHFILGLSTGCFPRTLIYTKTSICTPCLRHFSLMTRQSKPPPFHGSNGHSCRHHCHIFPPILIVNPQYVSLIIRTVADFKAHRHDDWVISNILIYNMADGRLSPCRNYYLPQVNVHR